MLMAAHGGISIHETSTALPPVINPLTFIITEKPSRINAPYVRNLRPGPVKRSFSRHLINCAPPLCRESSAIIRCSSRLMQYTSTIIQSRSPILFRDAMKGTDKIPAPTPWPIIILVASAKVSFASLFISILYAFLSVNCRFHLFYRA